jgi:hypothetical protein
MCTIPSWKHVADGFVGFVGGTLVFFLRIHCSVSPWNECSKLSLRRTDEGEEPTCLPKQCSSQAYWSDPQVQPSRGCHSHCREHSQESSHCQRTRLCCIFVICNKSGISGSMHV